MLQRKAIEVNEVFSLPYEVIIQAIHGLPVADDSLELDFFWWQSLTEFSQRNDYTSLMTGVGPKVQVFTSQRA